MEIKCPKCGNDKFSAGTRRDNYSNYEIGFVTCTQCGQIVGTIDATSINKLDELLKKIKKIEEKLSRY